MVSRHGVSMEFTSKYLNQIKPITCPSTYDVCNVKSTCIARICLGVPPISVQQHHSSPLHF